MKNPEPNMIMKQFFFLTAAFFLCSCALFAQTDEYCINENERKLYKLIDDYRSEKGLHTIPISRALTQLAKMHAKDIVNNRPAKATMSIHSWTNKGKWKSCDYTNDTKGQNCMQDKPAELTSYKHKGYELIAINENGEMTADFAMKDWKNNSTYGIMLVNKTGWQDKNWEAIGIAVYKNLAIVWLGENTDKSGAPVACPSNFEMKTDAAVVKIEDKPKEEPKIETPKTQCFIVYGSYATNENAQKGLADAQNAGFADAEIKEGDNMYKVVLSVFPSKAEAEKAITTLKGKFKASWVWEK